MRQREGFHWFRRWRPTPQQERVLDALTQGRSNAEIAAELGISADGAKWHVSQLLGETGLADRVELAGWWRDRRDRVEARRGLWPLSGLAVRAALVAPVVVVAAWLLTASPLATRDGREGLPSEAAPGARAATASAVPLPSPTPQASLAWVFDIATGSATPLQPSGALMRWLGEDRLLSYAGPSLVIVDARGALVAPAAGPRPQGPLYPDQATGRVLVFEGEQTLWEWEPVAGERRLLLDLGAAPVLPRTTSGRFVDVSAPAGRLALADVRDGGLQVEVMAIDGSNRRVVWREEGGAWVRQLAWAPDGSRLLLATATRRVDGSRVTEEARGLAVLDGLTGEVQLTLDHSAASHIRWAGPLHLLVSDAQRAAAPSTLLSVRDGSSIVGPDPDGLLCVSPNGRYGLYWYQAVTGSASNRPYGQRVVDLDTGDSLLERETRVQGGQCDWTQDSTKVVISPGGK